MESMSETLTGTGALEQQPLTTRRFSTNVALTLGTRLLILAASFGAGIIAARKLGPGGFGLLAVLNVIVALAVQFGCAGLPTANTYFLSRDRRLLRRISIISLTFSLFVGTILTVAIVILAWS